VGADTVLVDRDQAIRAFTLVELLVVVAVIALLIGLVLPGLAAARNAGRSAVCLSNLRQDFLICRLYADENRGMGPAIGTPYTAPPNWALVVQQGSGRNGDAPADLYSTSSSLVCPAARAHYGLDMTRTYAMNATGHAGRPGDPDNYDDANPPGNPPRFAHIRMDLVQRPESLPLLVDSAAAPVTPPTPPPTRTTSVLDFRVEDHVRNRVGRFHGKPGVFNAGMLDGSAHAASEVPAAWTTALP
jgi:prepilin-type N-terminal cleavage/methylation domain-containing protein